MVHDWDKAAHRDYAILVLGVTRRQLDKAMSSLI